MFRPLGLGLLLGVAAQAGAQSRHDLEAQVARLGASLHAAEAAEVAYADSMKAADQQLERFTIGSIVVRTTKRLQPVVAEGAARAREALERRLGAAAYRLSGMTFFVRPDPDPMATKLDLISVGMLGPDGRENWADECERNAQAIAQAIESRAVNDLSRNADMPFRRWLWTPVPLWGTTDQEWVRIRLLVVAEGNDTASACYAGDARACRLGLQFDGPYSSFNGRYLPALPTGVRPSLVSKALEMGGDGAMERLLRARGSPAQVISAAADVPIDKVIDAWAASMRNTRVASATMNLSLASTSLLLIIACAGAALRSSRWR